jgi:hypothetical protein
VARIYVSSTFTDLQDHREAVRNAIRRMGHTDVAMEYYVAEDRRPLDKCLADVRTCDLYVVVMAWRYGHIPPGQTDSITHLEYRAALDADKTCLAFVLDDKAPWPPHLMEFGKLAQVQAFRTSLTRGYLAGLFTSKDDLARQVTEALQSWERNQSGDPTTTTDWGTYRQAFIDRYRWVILSVIAGARHDDLRRIPLLDVFVSPRVLAGRPHYDVPDRAVSSSPEDSFGVLGRDWKQVFLGGPGSGKSTLFLAAALNLCNGRSSVVPFLIELREYVLRGSNDFIAYLRETAWDKLGVRVTVYALTELLSHGQAVIYFDGLDEIFESTARRRVIEQFRSFTVHFPRAWAAVSSRIVGYDENALGLAGFQHYTLLDFGMVEVRKFIPKWYEHYTLENDERDAAGLIRRISENRRLLELAGNPLLLTMMAIIYKHHDLPEKRWQLYQRCTDVLLEDWDVKRKRIERDELLPFPMVADQKSEILQNVAITMLSTPDDGTDSELNAISYELSCDIITGYLYHQYGKPFGEARAVAVEILNHLRERTYILAETGDRIFGFVHRTFMEYFAAKFILVAFNGNRSDYGWLKNQVFRQYWKNDRWREPLLLLSGMMAGQGSPIREVVEALMEDGALPFAARCLGEAGVVPREDRPWASMIVHALVQNLQQTLNMPDKNMYIKESVAAFELLSVFVDIHEGTRALMRKLAESKSASTRTIGWQLRFTLGSRSERLRIAVESLSHSDQAARRGAVAVLEREWPGDDQVLQAIVAQLLVEEDIRVREALLSGADSGWPRREEVLGAIAQRSAIEDVPSHAEWAVQHLAATWSGHPGARDVVLHMAGRQLALRWSMPWHESAHEALRDSVAQALVAGWSRTADMENFLQHMAMNTDDRRVQLTAIRAYLQFNPIVALNWLWNNLAALELHPLVDIFCEVITAKVERLVVLEWFAQIVISHPVRWCSSMAESALNKAACEVVEIELLFRGCARLHIDVNVGKIMRSAVRGIAPGWLEPKFQQVLEALALDGGEQWSTAHFVKAGAIDAAQDMLAVVGSADAHDRSILQSALAKALSHFDW